ncbi:MAG TPA: glycosyltransferase [Deltaproteobacteria bacterium]|nr:glycosyltransferase [Deltaproteobacteria bacterium]
MKAKKISVVIPVFNEEAVLEKLFERLIPVMESLRRDYEILMVDDGSTDRSLEIMKTHGGDRVIIVELTKNYGQHAAIFAGFENSEGDIVVTLDADLQNPPEEIPRLVSVMEEGDYEVVGSVRKARKDSVFRKIPSRVINTLTRRITGVILSDWGCMLRAYRRSVVDYMVSSHEHSTFIPALATSFAKRITEIEVEHEQRYAGQTKYSFSKLITLHFDLITSFSEFPLKLLLYLGFIMAFSGVGFGIFLAVSRIYFGAAWAAEGVFTLFAILFFFVGTQFFALGIMGEYVGRIYREVKSRPPYTIRRIY